VTLVITNREFHRLVLDTVPECTEVNPNFFFADPDDPEEPFGRSERAIAQGVCKRCPIVNECFANAINNREQYGVWGASVPNQRQAYWQKVDLN
jgi:WhiB family redox-sensing transcriptional regulator